MFNSICSLPFQCGYAPRVGPHSEGFGWFGGRVWIPYALVNHQSWNQIPKEKRVGINRGNLVEELTMGVYTTFFYNVELLIYFVGPRAFVLNEYYYVFSNVSFE